MSLYSEANIKTPPTIYKLTILNKNMYSLDFNVCLFISNTHVFTLNTKFFAHNCIAVKKTSYCAADDGVCNVFFLCIVLYCITDKYCCVEERTLMFTTSLNSMASVLPHCTPQTQSSLRGILKSTGYTEPALSATFILSHNANSLMSRIQSVGTK